MWATLQDWVVKHERRLSREVLTENLSEAVRLSVRGSSGHPVYARVVRNFRSPWHTCRRQIHPTQPPSSFQLRNLSRLRHRYCAHSFAVLLAWDSLISRERGRRELLLPLSSLLSIHSHHSAQSLATGCRLALVGHTGCRGFMGLKPKVGTLLIALGLKPRH